MAFKLILFPLFVSLIAVNLIFAEEESQGLFGLPSFDSGNNSGFNLPFSGLFNQLPLPLPFSFGSRQERSAEPQADDSEPQDRLVFGSIVSCNYTAQGGTTCSSCRQSLACYPNNVGRVRTCRGLLRYCNNGRCTFTPGSLCANSTA